MGTPNVKGMVNDPDFQKLPAAKQKEALSKLTNDSSFASLSDTDMGQFMAKMRTDPLNPQQKMSRALNASPTQFEMERNPQYQEGFGSSFLKTVGGLLTPGGVNPYPGMDQDTKSQMATQAVQENTQRKQAGYSLPYRALAPAAESLGVNVPGMEHNADIGNKAGVAGAATGSAALPIAAALLHDAATRGSTPQTSTVKATPETEVYSKKGDLVAASLRSNARVDMPAEANLAHSAIKEAMADKGYTPDMFEGRNGPQLFKDSVKHAIDLAEQRKAQPLNAIASETVEPKLLDANPELASRFQPGEEINYGRLNAERVKMNEELSRGNYYTKDPSKQAAVNEPTENTAAAVEQARKLLYDYAQKRTGVDLRPMQRQESALIKLQDSANVTANTLSAKEAQFNATPLKTKVAQTVKNLVAVKNNPVSSFFSYETPGITSPTKSFNKNIKRAFFDVSPSPADTTVAMQDNPLPGYLQKKFGFDAKVNIPMNTSYPDVQPQAVGKNPFGFDQTSLSSTSPNVAIPDALKKAISRELVNRRSGNPKTGTSKPR